MRTHRETVEKYFEGLRISDHGKILALLTDDIVCDIHGHRHLRGKEAFDAEIENDKFDGRPLLRIDRLIEHDDTVVAPHRGEARTRAARCSRRRRATSSGSPVT